MAKFMNLSGTVFSRLTVSKQGPRGLSNGIRWNCVCSCGKETLVSTRDLKSGHTKSCGCAQHEYASSRNTKLEGLVFGRLTVIHRLPSRGQNGALWLCRCECGKKVEARTGSLNFGAVVSCGCIRRDIRRQAGPDYTGLTFGRLQVEQKGDYNKAGKSQWVCKCNCGNTVLVKSQALKLGTTQSCGCIQREIAGSSFRDLTNRTFGRLFVIERQGSNHRGNALWRCQCSCGNFNVVSGNSLLSEGRVSCGCARIYRDASLTSEKKKMSGRIANHSRRARVNATGGTFTDKDISDRFRWQRGRCAMPWCRIKLNKDNQCIDHIISISPRTRNGVQLPNLNDRRNLQLACDPCNSRKYDKDPIQHSQENGWLL